MKKYIVTTTIRDSEILHRYARMEGWQLVIVGDRKTPPLSVRNAVILNPEDQAKLGYHITEYIPWNCIMRRSIGYVYALKHGAEVIATVDDDNWPLENWGFPHLGETREIKTVEERDFFDIVRYATDGCIWHRGTLYGDLGRETAYSFSEKRVCVGVQANLWKGAPDTDGICHLTCDIDKGSEALAAFGETIAVAQNCFSPFNTQNTAFIKEVAPAALLPFGGICLRMDDLWSAYVMQRIMWETPYRLLFGPATVDQKRNPHDIWEDASRELPFSRALDMFLSFLRKTKLPDTDVFGKFIALSEALEKQPFAPKGYSQLWRAWTEDISSCY